MSNTRQARVGEQDSGTRLDSWLGRAAELGVRSRSAAVHLIEDSCVSVNGAVCNSKKYALAAGDVVSLASAVDTGAAPGPGPGTSAGTGDHTPRATGSDAAGPGTLDAAPGTLLTGERIPLDIRFEDAHMIVLSKQADLVCHPSVGHESHTLAHALVYHCGPEHLGRLQGEDRPGIVHRLDRDTSGLMLAAKDDETQRRLQDMIRLRTLDRRYITLVQGIIMPETGLVDAGIARSRKDRLRMAVSEDLGARQAITTFNVLERYEEGRNDSGYTLLECHLFTGRTHQIRVHMNYIQHPVVGDPLYGRGSLERNLGLTRQFLHSWSVAFDHPLTGEPMSFTDALPADLEETLELLDGRRIDRTARGEEVFSAIDSFRLAREHAAWSSWF